MQGSKPLILFVFILSLTVRIAFSQSFTGRQTISFNPGWKFINEEDLNEGMTPYPFETSYIDKAWEEVTLPHTAHTEPLVIVNPWQGVSWYRKSFDADKAWEGGKIFVNFEGAMQTAEVWLNGKHLLTHKGGYLPFVIDISDDLQYEKQNLLTLRLDNYVDPDVPPGKPIADLDFCYYSGIYRNVFLTVTNPVHITDPFVTNSTDGGTAITYPEVSKNEAVVAVKSQVKNESSQAGQLFTEWILFDLMNNKVASARSPEVSLLPDSSKLFPANLIVPHPSLWSPDHPELYTLVTKVYNNNVPVDETTVKIGIRKFELSGNRFLLNGEKLYLNGTNRHQEYPYLGNAIPDNAQYRDAVKIREAGFNIVRLSHYPQSPAFMNACDELGLLVIDCIPGWQFFGNREFEENAYRDARELIRRDRNHACVAFWELSINETSMPDYFMKKMTEIAVEESPDQKLLTCGWMNSWYDLFIPARQHAKAPDYWKKHSDLRPFFTAEYGDWEYYAQNAGFNQSEFSDLKSEERTSRQLRGYGEKRMLQQALNFQEAHNDNLKSANIGDANWLMFDYNRGYAPDIEASGIMDIFRLPKYAFYFYQSQRSPLIKTSRFNSGPVIKIASHWNENSDTLLRVFSNCEEVALYQNQTLIVRKTAGRDNYSSMLAYPPFLFHVAKAGKGELKAVGYNMGNIVAEDNLKTAGNPAKIALTWDKSNKELTTGDVVFVYASICDKEGTPACQSSVKVKFFIEGDAELIGENPAVSEAGVASILLKTGPNPGSIKIKASGDGLAQDFMTISVQK